VYRYLLLGLLQGLAEFLPVSSSGHLVLAQRLLDLDPPGTALAGALHLATLAAVVLYFRRDLARLLKGGLVPGSWERRYLGLLGLGTIPIAAIGYLARGALERSFSSPTLVGGLFLATALALGTASVLQGRARRARPKVGDAAVVGLAQAAALLPGISRSGVTISAGILRGLSPAEAARFSFLLSIPAVAGAGMVSLARANLSPGEAAGLALGGLAALGSGLLAIRVLLRLLQRGRLWWFALYCLLVGGLALGFLR